MSDFSMKNTKISIDGTIVTDELELYKWKYDKSATIRITTYHGVNRTSTAIVLSKKDVKALIKNLKKHK